MFMFMLMHMHMLMFMLMHIPQTVCAHCRLAAIPRPERCSRAAQMGAMRVRMCARARHVPDAHAHPPGGCRLPMPPLCSLQGYKQSTWWEDNDQGLDVSADWRA